MARKPPVIPPRSYMNPFRPGNGQQPLYLAGRTTEQEDLAMLYLTYPGRRSRVARERGLS